MFQEVGVATHISETANRINARSLRQNRCTNDDRTNPTIVIVVVVVIVIVVVIFVGDTDVQGRATD